MYATLPLNRLIPFIALPYLLAFIAAAALTEVPHSLAEAWRLARSVLGYGTIAFLVFGGPSAWYAPWRWFWRIPGVNRFLFPDLNGVWKGTTSSNWPSIGAMLKTYDGEAQPQHAGPLDQVPLQVDDIEITITASFFRFRIDAKLTSTGGTSHSITERVCWNERRELFEVYYLYLQDTPSPAQTDESSHPGAGKLLLDMKTWTLSGEYWTRRSWRSGLNTAGQITVTRVSR